MPLPPGARYRVLAQLWWLVSPPALGLLLWQPAWLRATGMREALVAVRFEQWIALALLLLHAWFLWRAKLRPASGSVLPAACRQGPPSEVNRE